MNMPLIVVQKWAYIAEAEEAAAAQGASSKWYVIFDGPFAGLYKNWAIVNSHVQGQKYTFKKYDTKEEAQKEFNEAYKTITKMPAQEKAKEKMAPQKIRTPIIISDIMTTSEKIKMKQQARRRADHLFRSSYHHEFLPKTNQTRTKSSHPTRL